MELQNNVPKLRFSKFSDEWIKLPLNKVVTVNPKNEELPDSFIYIDLESVTNGALSKEERINKNESPSRAQRLLKRGDILYQTVRPYQKNNYYFDKVENDYVASTGYAQLRTENISNFIFQYIHTHFFVNEVLLRCTGTSYPAINSTDLSKIKISIPKLQEQQKIATFLTSVDKKIEQLKQKKTLLEEYKKEVMQQIFSQELRFKDDNKNDYSDWEEKKLGELFENIGGTPLEKYFDKKGKHKVVSIGNYGIDGIYNDNQQRIVLNEKTKTKLLNKDDLVMVLNDKTKTGDIIGSTILIPSDNEYIYNQRSERLIPNKELLTPKFAWTFLNSIKFRKSVFKASQGGTQIYINFSEVKKLSFPLPSIKEQTQIANFLSAIDAKIELVNTQIKNTEQFKKGLLQQMFV